MKLAIAATMLLAGANALLTWNPDALKAQAEEELAILATTRGSDDGEIPGGSPIELCDLEEDHLLKIKEVVIDPNPPEAGENLTIHGSGTLKTEVVDGSYVDVIVYYGFIQLIRQRYDLCETLSEVDLECPLSKGDLDLTRVVELPDSIPPGQYSVSARAYTAEDELLTCLTGQVVFG